MTARQWLEGAVRALREAGDPDARLEARWMLEDALKLGAAGLTARLDEEAPGAALDLARAWLDARLSGLPLQYAQGRAWFMGHEFFVDRRVLIPRPDTELLCEIAIERAGRETPGVLDLCTGSGAVAVSLKLALPRARVCACDLSEDALDVARQNARRLGAEIEFFKGDFLEAVGETRFDVIACNPPYLTDEDMRCLQKEVRFEPELALRGGADGLDFYRRAALEAPGRLRKGGCLLLEVGAGQAEAVCALLGAGATAHADIQGISRVVEKRY